MKNFLWTEHYRPKNIDECILPDDIKAIAKGYVKSGRMPTAIFTGGAGTGKTTLAKAIASELGADILFINASMEGNIDTIRTKIAQFASTVSFSNSKKITVLDEADGLTGQAQQALRGFIEEFSGNHSIIFTCNYLNKLIDPLKSRSAVIHFKISNIDKAKLASQFFKRVTSILEAEEVKFDKKIVAELVNKTFPDFRRCLNELEKYAKNGSIDSGLLIDLADEAFNELFMSLDKKKFNDMRKWVAEHSDLDPTSFYRMFYDKIESKVSVQSLPSVILTVADYSYKAAFVADQEINTTAFLTEIMMSGDIKWK